MKNRFNRIIWLLVFLSTGSFLFSQQEEVLELRERPNRMNGIWVEKLQRMLVYYGFDLGKDGADGWFGPSTETALKGYQKLKGLKVTGKIKTSQIETDLAWEPELARWKSKKAVKASSKQKKLNIEEGKKLKLSNYYGNHTISTLSKYEERYYDYILSPSGRFAACMSYNPHAEGGGYSISLICMDLLTGKTRMIYGGITLREHTDIKEIDEFETIVDSYFWNDEEQLIFTVSGHEEAEGLFFVLNCKK